MPFVINYKIKIIRTSDIALLVTIYDSQNSELNLNATLLKIKWKIKKENIRNIPLNYFNNV